MPSVSPTSYANGHGKPRVFTLEPLHSAALKLAREKFDLVLPSDPDFVHWREEAEGLMARNAEVTPADVEVLKVNKLKYISKQGVGVDNFDLPSLTAAGIPLMNTPGVNAQAVAELAIALIADVARNVTTIDRRIRSGIAVTKLDGWTGQTLKGRSLGVVGGGNIGRLVAKMFHGAYEGHIYLYDPFLTPSALSSWTSTITKGSLTVISELDHLLSSADIVTLHVPLTKGTKDLITKRELGLMKTDSIIVNTARGGIINEEDLAEVLANGGIFGAGFDAFVNEPPSLNGYPSLCSSDRCVLLPHIGAATEAAQQETCLSMVEHLVEAFEGKPLRDRVC